MIAFVVVLAPVVITALLVIPAASWSNGETWGSLTAAGIAYSLMAVNIVLSARYRPLEKLFGGLDRVYFAHKWLGISAFGFMLIHYLIEPNFKGLALSSQLNEVAAEVGDICFLALAGLILISFVKRIPKVPHEIPYRIWRWSHNLMGPLFIAISFHQAFIKRPYSGADALSDWLNILAVIGIVSYLYGLIMPWLRNKKYEVVSVDRLPIGTVIRLKPKGKGIKIKAGQFAFLSIQKSGLKEAHPFTVATAEDDGTLTFAIRPLGDFTKRLRDSIDVGDVASVAGGYGGFALKESHGNQVWLAGGIGITPFLSFSHTLPPKPNGGSYHLIHVVSDAEQAISRQALEAIAMERDDFHYSLYSSADNGRFNAQKLTELLAFDAAGSDLWFCGPTPMRLAIEKGLKSLGQSPKTIHFERFEFR
nr:ferric reductase-like transmembrane domain-containing protein [uncultured Cohaesibacter sp.]